MALLVTQSPVRKWHYCCFDSPTVTKKHYVTNRSQKLVPDIDTDFSCSPKAESSNENFHKLKCCQGAITNIHFYGENFWASKTPQITYQIYLIPVLPKLNTLKALLGFSGTLRCTKSLEMKDRCSQTEFKAMATWFWDAQCGSWGRRLVGPLLQLRCLCFYDSPWKTIAERYFRFLPFFL